MSTSSDEPAVTRTFSDGLGLKPTSQVIGKLEEEHPSSPGLRSLHGHSPAARPELQIESTHEDILETIDLEPDELRMAKQLSPDALPPRCKTSTVAYMGAKSTIILFLSCTMIAAFIGWRVLEDDKWTRNTTLSCIFAVGLGTVALEDVLHFNKSATMLLCAGIMWTVLAVSDHPIESEAGMQKLDHQLEDGVEEIGKILLFLLPAMGLCETIDHFDGFAVIAHSVRYAMGGRKQMLLPIICLFTFVMCIVVDSMSAMLVSLKTLQRLSRHDDEWRRKCGALAVLGANACVWSPIGEVTTAMLWINGKITPLKIAAWLILPSLASLLVPLAILWGLALRNDRLKGEMACRKASRDRGFSQVAADEGHSGAGENTNDVDQIDPGDVESLHKPPDVHVDELSRSSIFVFCLGISCIITVPILKLHTGLPPYFGMLFALGLMWFIMDMIALRTHGVKDHSGHSGVMAALHKVDLAGLLFFAGVLQSVAALDSAHILRWFAHKLKITFGDNPFIISIALGISSSLVDNVPLVEAAIDMFDHAEVDSPLWQLVALAAGTGGSLLITGGIAGVTFMGVEGVSFAWYFRNVTLYAIIGFFSGIFVYFVQRTLVG